MIAKIIDFAAELDVRAFDLQTGDLLTHEGGTASFDQWANYRSHAVEEPKAH